MIQIMLLNKFQFSSSFSLSIVSLQCTKMYNCYVFLPQFFNLTHARFSCTDDKNCSPYLGKSVKSVKLLSH